MLTNASNAFSYHHFKRESDDLLLTVSNGDEMEFSPYLKILHPLKERRNNLEIGLPPLVPPSYEDEEHFEERQVYNIPRVGRSFNAHEAQDYGRASLSFIRDEDAAANGPSRQIIAAEFGDNKKGLRQVFSKIPRVGRSVSRIRRMLNRKMQDESRKVIFHARESNVKRSPLESTYD